ncbi:MAG: Response regulator of zinc sigma-54-dependent two-component system [Verrucomicrobiales bacterium]|nr:Response regulator of zinc sigma-54-dependent two-component system [Verrucomicrobiales bacterium]
MSPSAKEVIGRPCILIVDDDQSQRSLIDTFLRSQDFDTNVVSSGEEALTVLDASRVSMMVSDVRMNGISGLETLRRARIKHSKLPVLLVTGYADIREAVGAMRDGALNYLAKPIDLDELLTAVRQATGLSDSAPLRGNSDKPLPPNVVSASPLMQSVFRDASLVAASDSRVLLSGESGVGKEVLADVIHAWSNRNKVAMVKINCAAIPETLLESELFGHVKGAFTGAVNTRIGLFERADGGTIFLDEIGEMTSQLQAKLLRVTQDGRIHRVGSNQEIQCNVRIIAASNKNLEELVKKGLFREDLFYRLNVIELNIPPLRERQEDILPLATKFISEFSQSRSRFSSAVSKYLLDYKWPGNVRELRNTMERAALLSRGELIMPEHLTSRVRSNSDGILDGAKETGGQEKLEGMEREAIVNALQKHDYNRTETAKALGISRRALLYKLQRLRELGFPVDSLPRQNN